MVQGTCNLAKLRHHGFLRPMKLKAKVKATSKETSGSACQAQMSEMMSCWRENGFEDVACKKEIEMFLQCVARVRADPEQYKSKGRYPWTSTQVNERLRRCLKDDIISYYPIQSNRCLKDEISCTALILQGCCKL